MEAVLSITQHLCLFAQTEKYFVAAMGPEVLAAVHNGLFADYIEVIDPTTITVRKSDMERRSVSVNDLTTVGGTCLERAKLEFERRYCSNSTEDVNNSSIRITDAAAFAVMLDLRTCKTAPTTLRRFEFPALSLNGLGSKLKEEYIELWVNAKRKHLASLEAATACASAETAESASLPQGPTVDAFGFAMVMPAEYCKPDDPPPSDETLREDAEKAFTQVWAQWAHLSDRVQAKMAD